MKRLILGTCLLALAVSSAFAETPTSKPVAVPFELLLTKHMLVKIKINGKGPYRVVFDTGAAVSLLSTKAAKDAGMMAADAPQPLLNLFGPAEPTKIKSLELGSLKAQNVPIIILDHPTIQAMSQVPGFGPVEGILGFPFFARYTMTLDYQAKELTFAPNGYEPADVLQVLNAIMTSTKPGPKVLAPAAVWGITVDKKKDDETAGVTITQVRAASPAAKAGLQAGDRLLTLDDRWTDSVADCYLAAGYVKPGTEVCVTIQRGDKELTLKISPQRGL
jgi:hypothetical protein